ncbi:MAG: NAD(+) synthetase, partial [Chloroflexota bacterium]
GQTDEAEMGISYQELDEGLAALEIKKTDHIKPEVLARIIEMVAKSEHKRRMPPVCEVER